MLLKDAAAKMVWKYFAQMNLIPRPSGHEEKVMTWLRSFACEHSLNCKTDSVGNLLMIVPASPGYESAACLCIQNHVDMVCEKTPGKIHDFLKDPIELVEKDGWIYANDTTLGADNGIGAAMALALAADKDALHPRLELLFTVDEETGLTGAQGLDSDWLNASMLINLDTENEQFILGCAGGQETTLNIKADWIEQKSHLQTYRISVSGLRGGHSGINIHEKRANAIKLLARTIDKLSSKLDLALIAFGSGSARNVIPRDGWAQIAIPKSDQLTAAKIVSDMQKVFEIEYAPGEIALELSFEQIELQNYSLLSQDTASKFIDVLLALPHGPITLSSDYENVVETSNNLALARIENRAPQIQIHSMHRSCIMSKMAEVARSISAVARMAGADIIIDGTYPAWQPRLDSRLLRVCESVYTQMFKHAPVATIVHAGLECGIIGQKYPGMDMISFGPLINNAHSPKECACIASVDKFWLFLLELLKSIK